MNVRSEALTDPTLRAKASKLFDLLEEIDPVAEDPEGTYLLEEIRDLFVRQGELDFEKEIKDHPYGVQIAGLGTRTFAQEKEEGMLSWLKEHVAKSDYIMMPSNAMGKYSECWNCIYFKDPDMAVLFKLIWA